MNSLESTTGAAARAGAPVQPEAGVQTAEAFFPARDGTRLFARSWTPPGAIKADVLLAHGMGEHSARYFHVGKFFAERGYRLCAFDMRGHGRSSGPRGYVESYGLLLDDLQT